MGLEEEVGDLVGGVVAITVETSDGQGVRSYPHLAGGLLSHLDEHDQEGGELNIEILDGLQGLSRVMTPASRSAR